MKKLLFLVIIMMLSIYSGAYASRLSVFDSSWTQFADDDGYRGCTEGYVNPGYGGQLFDAEYLFYKLQGSILSIGLQTGFNLNTGKVTYDNVNYYAGDLALSFDGNSSTYEYAADFGLYTKDYVTPAPVGGNKASGIDTAGIYRVNNPGTTGWNKDVYFTASNPFAMKSGNLLTAFDSSTNLTGSDSTTVYHTHVGSYTYYYGGYSYYRIVSFPVTLISEISDKTINLAAHWTMSCGNDVLNGSAIIQRPVVPEPDTMFLLGSLATGLFGLAGLRKRFTK
ncbi:MAG: PEP-CTERM sorting domain-containing protein [bacterium]|nr:PEP-CTERM sorting domain-containing protein [bacterium]